MSARHRVLLFQQALVDVVKRNYSTAETDVEMAGIATLTLLGEVINAALDNGAFDDDVPEVRSAPTEEG